MTSAVLGNELLEGTVVMVHAGTPASGAHFHARQTTSPGRKRVSMGRSAPCSRRYSRFGSRTGEATAEGDMTSYVRE